MGLFDKSKTYTGMFFVNLHEPDISLKAIRKQLVYTTKTMSQYNMGYWTWKHGYKTRYTRAFLIKYGYATVAEGTALTVDAGETAKFMTTVDPQYGYTISAGMGIVSADIQLRSHLQWSGYVWNNIRNELNVDGTIFTLSTVSFKENPDPSKDDDESAIVGTFVKSGYSDYVIEFANMYQGTKAFLITYARTGDDTDYYVYVTPTAVTPNSIASSSTLMLTPIVPLKIEGEMIQETKNMKKMMRKLHVDIDDFTEVLEKTDDDGEPEIDNAYLVNGIPLLNPYAVEVKEYTASEAEKLSVALIKLIEKRNRTTSKSSTNNEEDDESTSISDILGKPESDEDVKQYNVTAEIAHEWYYTHLREQNYLAKALFRTFAYYSGLVVNAENPPKSVMYLGEIVRDVAYNGPISGAHSKGKPTLQELIDNHFASNPDNSTIFVAEDMDMTYMYNISVQTMPGTVRGLEGITDRRSQGSFKYTGMYISAKDDEGDRSSWTTDDYTGQEKLVIKVQITPSTYQVMTIVNYSNTFAISEHGFTNFLGSPAQEHRLLLPISAIENIPFREYITTYEHSFMMLAYAEKTVTVSLWKRFIGVFIGFALSLFLGPAGMSIGAMITELIVNMVMQLIIESIIEMLDSEILKMVFNVALTLYNMFSGVNFDFSKLTVENYLKIATDVSGAISDKHNLEQAKLDAEKQKELDAVENIEDKLDNYSSSMSLSPKAILSAHYSFKDATSPETLYTQMLGGSLYDYDQFYNVDREIETRKQVTSG